MKLAGSRLVPERQSKKNQTQVGSFLNPGFSQPCEFVVAQTRTEIDKVVLSSTDPLVPVPEQAALYSAVRSVKLRNNQTIRQTNKLQLKKL